jgi:ABC-type lipoprotein release transport system permease subunit
VGRTFNFWRGDARIIGVVPTGKYRELRETPEPFFYLCAWQIDNRNLGLVVRTGADPRQLAQPVQRVARSLRADATPTAFMTFEAFVAAAFTIPRVAATLLVVLGMLALCLAVMGIYAVMSQSVGQRIRELGVRLALGAQSRDVRGLILGQGLKLAVLGMTIGALAGIGVNRVLSGLLVGISATDGWTWLIVPPLMLAAAFAACWLPARRASRVDPMEALRSE